MDDLSEEVRRIQAAHYHDGDGGYGAVRAIRALWDALEPRRRLALKSVLVEFVVCREAKVWSLALEALVQGRAWDVAPTAP